MSDKMRVQSFEVLFRRILSEFEAHRTIFGIHESLFFKPKPRASYAVKDMYGSFLATPVGPAAGPHTQLAQNIVCAWLSGGRFIELKTVQVMDELEIPRPCIDMEDEGYNVEWSQELKLEESADQYVTAWALIHLLRRLLGFDTNTPFGTIFNMSVGYDLKGIQSEPMTRFMDSIQDASEKISRIKAILAETFPEFADVEIPTCVSNNVTLSTMHGCPPDEIENIGRYLLLERKLHTNIKLNPTLLGRRKVQEILHRHLGYFDITIPYGVFEKDLDFQRAVQLIETLGPIARRNDLIFGVKLSNTLPLSNHKHKLPGDEMYMSGRALYPLTVHLFRKLVKAIPGGVKVSYSAGADAWNIARLLECGACPVTVATDILKPGGYSRFLQYIENIESAMVKRGADSLEEFTSRKSIVLQDTAEDALRNPRYMKRHFRFGLPKVASRLPLFDCIEAPCKASCAVGQDIPEYLWWIAREDFEKAMAVILRKNPLPGVTGYVCTHLCETTCTRNNYDAPVSIRALKRFAQEKANVHVKPYPRQHGKVAVIGSGPSGLSAAYYLALNGIDVTIFEAGNAPGGMLNIAPEFRLASDIVRRDILRILELGVTMRLDTPVKSPPTRLLEAGFDAVYIAVGFQDDVSIDIPGSDGPGVMQSLDFLRRAGRDALVKPGEKITVIGGGNTAMDVARTAARLAGNPATLVYRRSMREMPAEEEEIAGFLEEGNILIELAAPVKVVRKDGKVEALECIRNELGEPDAGGRRRPVPIPGSEFRIFTDKVIYAIGQKADTAFAKGTVHLKKNGAIEIDPDTGETRTSMVFAGGDVTSGPSIIIKACADGRRAAEAICKKLGLSFREPAFQFPEFTQEDILLVKKNRAMRLPRLTPPVLPPEQRKDFRIIEKTFDTQNAVKEASRCLQCAAVCDKCVEVCPNRANYVYSVKPTAIRTPVIRVENGVPRVVREEVFEVRQPRQILHVDDFCNECGNCETFCVHDGKPFREKPRLFLDEAAFRAEDDNAFFIDAKRNIIRYRSGKIEARLTVDDGTRVFERGGLHVVLDEGFRVREMRADTKESSEASLLDAAMMFVIYTGVRASLGFLVEISEG